MESEVSLLYSQQPANGSYFKMAESTHPLPQMVSSFQVFRPNLSSYPMRAVYPAHLFSWI